MNVASPRDVAGVVIAAVCLAVLGVPAPSSSQPSDTISVIKAETPPSNVDIAVALSQVTTFDALDTVLIGRDDNFADALASGVLQSRSPLLLVPSAGPVPDEVVEEIERLDPSRAVVLGGEAAVQPAVEQQLRDMGLDVERRAGGSRFDTAITIARTDAGAAETAILARAFPSEGSTDPTQGFADSIAAGGMSAEMGWPVLLTQSDTLTEATRTYLAEAGIQQVEIMGGTAAISAAVEQQIRDMGITTERLAGNSRAETALAVADKLGAPTAADADHVVVVQGQTADAWAGGFAAAAHAASLDAPIVLATGDTLPPATLDWLRDGVTDPTYADTGYAVVPGDGGPVLTCVVVPSLCEEARVTLGLPPDTGAAGPLELLSTDADGTATGGFAPAVSGDGTVVAFVSDGPVAGLADPTEERYHAYLVTPDGTEMLDTTPSGQPASGDSSSVHVSGNGQVVAFTSEDPTLAGQDVDASRTAYVRDLATGSTRAVSFDIEGTPGNYVDHPSLDEDGSVVTYVSQGSVGRPTSCSCYWYWWHDLDSGEIGYVATPDGEPVEAEGSHRPMLSGDGRWIAFMTSASLLPLDTNTATDAYVLDRTTGTLELVSVTPDGTASTATEFNLPDEIGISHDGRFVAFAHEGADLVNPPATLPDQVYLRDRTAGTTTLVSPGGEGQGTRLSANPQVSPNGEWVVFASFRTLSGDGAGCGVYRWSVAEGTLDRIDVDPVEHANNCPFRSDVANDGTVVLDHLATLHAGDDTHQFVYGGWDVYRSGPG